VPALVVALQYTVLILLSIPAAVFACTSPLQNRYSQDTQ
jgi:hypothetical protein